MTDRDFHLITCEHGGNRVPARYAGLFLGHEPLLRTHRAYDAGALRLARDFAAALAAPLMVSTISRLLIDLNRSPGHPRLYSEATRKASGALRAEIFEGYYLPYRARAEGCIADAIAAGMRVVHISCHSFTPEWQGKARSADLGLLYDPSRAGEAGLCRRWQAALSRHAPALKTRRNYPYLGTADGFTVHLRRRFPADRYLGIELEVNQSHVRGGDGHWREVRQAIIGAFREA